MGEEVQIRFMKWWPTLIVMVGGDSDSDLHVGFANKRISYFFMIKILRQSHLLLGMVKRIQF